MWLLMYDLILGKYSLTEPPKRTVWTILANPLFNGKVNKSQPRILRAECNEMHVGQGTEKWIWLP